MWSFGKSHLSWVNFVLVHLRISSNLQYPERSCFQNGVKHFSFLNFLRIDVVQIRCPIPVIHCFFYPCLVLIRLYKPYDKPEITMPLIPYHMFCIPIPVGCFKALLFIFFWCDVPHLAVFIILDIFSDIEWSVVSI